jgi:hypothetical protein
MNYECTGRTNYFKVKDVDAFQKWVSSFGGQFITKTTRVRGKDVEHPNLVGIILDGVPDMKANSDEDEGDDLIAFDFYEELKGHLKKGQVAIYIESGSEGHRYINGFAVAMCPGKKDLSISIDEIYSLATKKFRVAGITEATY